MIAHPRLVDASRAAQLAGAARDRRFVEQLLDLRFDVVVAFDLSSDAAESTLMQTEIPTGAEKGLRIAVLHLPDLMRPPRKRSWPQAAMTFAGGSGTYFVIVGAFLERSGATVESIALNLGFASHTALRNLIKRYTKLTASEVRKQGGLEVLLDAMRERIARQPAKALPLA